MLSEEIDQVGHIEDLLSHGINVNEQTYTERSCIAQWAPAPMNIPSGLGKDQPSERFEYRKAPNEMKSVNHKNSINIQNAESHPMLPCMTDASERYARKPKRLEQL